MYIYIYTSVNPCIYMHGAGGAKDCGKCAVLLDRFAEACVLHNGFEPANCVFSKLPNDSGPVKTVFSKLHEGTRPGNSASGLFPKAPDRSIACFQSFQGTPDQEIQPLELLPKGLRTGKYRCFRSFRIFRIFRYFWRSRSP